MQNVAVSCKKRPNVMGLLLNFHQVSRQSKNYTHAAARPFCSPLQIDERNDFLFSAGLIREAPLLHAWIIGRMDFPSSLKAYSTLGGTSLYTVRITIPSFSTARKLSVNPFRLMPSKSFRSSLNCQVRVSKFPMISNFQSAVPSLPPGKPASPLSSVSRTPAIV